MPTLLYALIEQRPDHENFGKPFYIGIGSAKRPYTHMKKALSRRGHYNPMMQAFLTEHILLGVQPEVKIVSVFDAVEDARNAEREEIKRYGRILYEDSGILCNIARGGEGFDPELMNDSEFRAKVAMAAKRYWESPGNREKHDKLMKEIIESPDWREKVSAATKKAINLPEVRERHVAALRRISASITSEQKSEWGKNVSDEVRAKRIAALEACRNDPEIRARHAAATSAGLIEYWSDPEVRAAASANLKGRKKARTAASDAARRANAQKGNTPEANAKKAEASRLRWADPEFRQRMSESRKASWQDPEKRTNMLQRPSKGTSHVYRGGSARDPEIRNALRRESYRRKKETKSGQDDSSN